MEERYLKAQEILEKYGQEHLLMFYANLSEADQNTLLNQILSIDFELMKKLYEKARKQEKVIEKKVEPISHIDKEQLDKEELEEFIRLGKKDIKEGKLAIITMAGGQGTRLGHEGPKGTFILDDINNKSLFEIYCDNLKEAYKEYGIIIKWYIMTSKQNHSETVEFFDEHNFFEYPKEAITFFTQGELPILDVQGNIALEENGLIKEAADGHGGIFDAMFKNNIVKDLEKNNIEWVFIHGVDNSLAKIIDPLFIGIAKMKKVLAIGKSVVKARPEEKVGVFCKKDKRPSVIEYTEISEEMTKLIDEKGDLVYGESHILLNMFNIDAIKEIGGNRLEFHPAFKKASYIDLNGNKIEGTEPNTYKFESFIFDAFERLDNMVIFRTKREEEFAPLKNATGVDSIQTARGLFKKYHNIK